MWPSEGSFRSSWCILFWRIILTNLFELMGARFEALDVMAPSVNPYIFTISTLLLEQCSAWRGMDIGYFIYGTFLISYNAQDLRWLYLFLPPSMEMAVVWVFNCFCLLFSSIIRHIILCSYLYLLSAYTAVAHSSKSNVRMAKKAN